MDCSRYFAVAVEADELPQECGRQKVLARLVFLLENNLREHRAGDVVSGLGVIDKEVFAVLHHGGQILKCDVGAGAGVVEAPVGVLFDRNRLVGFCHGLTT
jgi:hypothetical protein